MSKGINKVIIVGNAARDPETRYMPSGAAVTNFTVATSEFWKDKDSGERKEKTEFHRCVAFNKLGEIVGEYLKKGGKVYVEGSLRTRQYEKDGQKHYATEIVVSEFQMLDSKGRDAGPTHRGDDHGFDQPAPAAARQPAPADDWDSEIPF